MIDICDKGSRYLHLTVTAHKVLGSINYHHQLTKDALLCRVFILVPLFGRDSAARSEDATAGGTIGFGKVYC